jgi:hypothetical protein
MFWFGGNVFLQLIANLCTRLTLGLNRFINEVLVGCFNCGAPRFSNRMTRSSENNTIRHVMGMVMNPRKMRVYLKIF